MYYYIRWLYTFLRTLIWYFLQFPRSLIQPEEVIGRSENPLSLQRLKYHVFKDLLALQHEAKLGDKAPNCEVKTLEGASCNLLDFMKAGRPLVLNFDLFIEDLQDFKEIVKDFDDVADFMIVYMEEAHPVEGWRIRDNYEIKEHRSMEDRLQAAQMLASLDPLVPIVVDPLDNQALTAYASFPERLYIVQDGRIAYEGRVGPVGYDLKELRHWLNGWKGQLNVTIVVTMPLLAELLQSVLVGLTVVKCTVIVGLLRIASSLPFLKERLQEFEEQHNLVPYQNFWDDYGGKKMLAVVLKIFLGDLNKTAVLGSSAPNCKLVTTDEKPCKLLDFARGTRPLIVNFGNVADFVIVYICEAHPTDEWRWNNNVEILQHRTLQERCQAAEMLKKSSGCSTPILVDTMDNEATQAYGAYPERLFIIQDRKIVYEGGTGPYNYSLGEVKKWLEVYKASR
ncbi:unnamed protein product [Porites lobata]|uniref:Iodothyronine deiodinase n=1 Tax=Porites lobata TaxID=104759 RepID=A0ABN8N6A0_9CNID|nr:unnamed protein product [Porites lobata]